MIEDNPYYCKYCKRVIPIAFKLHMRDKHGIGIELKNGIIELKNGSKIYVMTDENKYKHVEGKSIKYIKLDEFID